MDTPEVQQNIKAFNERYHAYYKAFWKLLHLLAYQYPMDPSPKHKEIAFDTFSQVEQYLTCDKCVKHWKHYMKTIDIQNKETLMLWLYNVHNDINKKNNKPLKDKMEFWSESFRNEDEDWLFQTYGVGLHGTPPDKVFEIYLKQIREITGYEL